MIFKKLIKNCMFNSVKQINLSISYFTDFNAFSLSFINELLDIKREIVSCISV